MIKTFTRVSIFLIVLCISFNTAKAQTTATEAEGDSLAVIPEQLGFVSDYGFIFTPEQRDTLTRKIRPFYDSTNTVIAIATWDMIDLFEEGFDHYLYRTLNAWHPGEPETNNIIIIGFCKRLQKFRIFTGKGVERKLTDKESDVIMKKIIVPEFKTGNYYGGIKKALDAIIKTLLE